MFFFLNDTATTQIYTYCHPLSLPSALPILSSMGIPEPPINLSPGSGQPQLVNLETWMWLDPSYWDPRVLTTSASVTSNSGFVATVSTTLDRKSTRLNSSH